MTLQEAKKLKAAEDNLDDALRQLEEAESCLVMVASYRDQLSGGPKDWHIGTMLVRFAENYFARYPRNRSARTVDASSDEAGSVQGLKNVGSFVPLVHRLRDNRGRRFTCDGSC